MSSEGGGPYSCTEMEHVTDLFTGQIYEGILVCVIVLLGTSIGAMLWPRVAAVMLVFYIAGWAILAGIFKILTAFRIRKQVKGEWMLKHASVLDNGH